MELKPLNDYEIYVFVSPESESNWRMYKQAPTFYNQHAIAAIFLPVNNSDMVLVAWSHGGFNVAKRKDIHIFHIEKLELRPAFET